MPFTKDTTTDMDFNDDTQDITDMTDDGLTTTVRLNITRLISFIDLVIVRVLQHFSDDSSLLCFGRHPLIPNSTTTRPHR